MNKRLFVIGLALLFALGLTKCGDEVDQDELREADNLVNGLGLMSMMTNVDVYSGYSLCTPPLGWLGPYVFNDMPEGNDTLFYQFTIKIPFDSLGTFIDSMLWLVMPEPDVWQDDTLQWTGIDTWIRGENRNMVYFHTQFSVADTMQVTGSFKWNWEDTYYSYDYTVSTQTEAASIDIGTSANIGLSAQFRFGDDGSGSTDDNYARWNNTIFVRYEFFAQPDANGYDGYYILLSEAWKVEHYFVLQKPPA